MKKLLFYLLSLSALSLTTASFAAQDISTITHWKVTDPNHQIFIPYDHLRHSMIITNDYEVDGKRGCVVFFADGDATEQGAGPGDIVFYTPSKNHDIKGIFLRSECVAGEDENLAASGTVEYFK